MSNRKNSASILNANGAKNNQNLTPSNRKTSKSPFSNSKCAHQVNQQQTVSYGQLQIVLENIQTIKSKASAQIKLLNEENNQLKEELNNFRESSMEAINKKKQWEKQNIQLQVKWRSKVEELQLEIRKKMNTIEQKDSIIRKLERDGQTLELSNSRMQEEIDQLKQKWKWAFDILAGDESQGQEIVWKIKHLNCNLWQILDSRSSLNNIYELNKQKIQSLTQQLIRIKEEHDQTNKILEKTMNELSSSTQKLATTEQKVKEYSEYLVTAKERQYQLEKQLKESLNKNDTKQQEIMNLQHRVSILTQELAIKKEAVVEKDKKNQYYSLISELCDQTEDYSKVLERIRYLQRFRTEHYRNVQKIQFLCKQL